MTLWTPTKEPRNSRLLNPRLSSDTERSLDATVQGWTLHYVYDARAEEITRGEAVKGDEGRDEEPNEYDIVTIRANAVSFAPFHLSLFAR